MTPSPAPSYLDYARRALRTGQLAFDDGDWVYAIFYAANAVLELEGLSRNKHSALMGAEKFPDKIQHIILFGCIHG